MSKILKYILFRTVLLIIALHAVIPHPHSDELTEDRHFELHQNSNSIIGLIKIAFHESDDENLDNLVFVQIESVKKFDYKFTKVSNFNITLSIIEEWENEKIVSSNINNFKRLFFVKLNGLRGPPSTI